ncbi:hypothetical protein VOLCADRAFT_88089 [Volvox carteri f. nagariensis]|uniref:Uncharacterized protein n=1 Tax=Volvox carteri f. nagariensis TaxID=3068 RepID=D8TN17_VOLCA|nr:uncharacterized protein VOLCADRAFT_88089 [Volvox carteri f. nagariensis]EFJ51348.1 hypothetical protein VOLCADRAFT_88089 [Volvox carteri f. nagariensis]|eukprot:XP_002947815.1 hypothetical protein VOLCADRAFT_88089 [Volvox carteri f. nagariensis]
MDILPEDYDAQSQGSPDAECEVLELREQIAMLTKQFYQERQQWLEEKRRLQEATKPIQPASSLQFQQTDDLGRTGSRLTHQRMSSGMFLGSEAGSEAVCEDASQGGLSAREPCSSFCSSCQSTRSASPNQTGSAAGSSSTASMDTSGTKPELLLTLTDLRRQLEESRRQQDSASMRWALEREALQRQIHALISMSADTTSGGLQDGGGLESGAADGILTRGSLGHTGHEGEREDEDGLLPSERVSSLEMMVEELQSWSKGQGHEANPVVVRRTPELLEKQLCMLSSSGRAERDNLVAQLRVLAADATRARRETRGTVELVPCPALTPQTSAPAAAAAATPSLTPRSRSPSPVFATLRRRSSSSTSHPSGGGGGGLSTFHAPTLRDSVSAAELLAEKAVLERELRRYREECVAVPRAEYAELSSLRNQMAFMETEMEQLRGEVEEAVKMREAAEAEMAEALQDCVAVPQDEYQRLLCVEAESRAREAVCAIEAASPAVLHSNTQSVPLEEHRRLLAAVQERDALADQITALQQKLVSAKSEAQAATAAQKDAEEAAAAAAAEVEAAADASASAAAAAAAADAAATQFELVALREQLAATVEAAVAESKRLGMQVSELYEELEMLRNRNLELEAEAEAARHALASGQVQASGKAQAAAAAAEKAHSVLLGELHGLKSRIAELEEELGEARRAVGAAEEERNNLSMELAAEEEERVGAVVGGIAGGYDGVEDGGGDNYAAAAVPGAMEGFEEGESDDVYDVQSRLRILQEELEAMRRAQQAAQEENDVLMREAEAVRQALADTQAAREAAEAAAAAAAAASEAAARELDATKVQLAEAQALEQLFNSKRECFQLSRRVVRGLPPEWLATVGSTAAAATTAAAPAPGGGGGHAFERLGSGGTLLTSVPLPAEAVVSEEEEEEEEVV